MFWKKKKSKSASRSKKSSRRSKKSSRRGGKRKAFGGYSISFSGRKETVEEVFGKGNLPPSEMTKRLWKFVKAKRLASKG